MKKSGKIIYICLIFATVFAMLYSCGQKPAEEAGEGGGDAVGETGGGEVLSGAVIDENGFWKGIRALDFVELFDYKAMPIPNDTHQISDAALQSEIDTLLSAYSTPLQITDRAIEAGDKVNIDYVGSVGGVEFEGGSTGGAGTDVTAGSTDYIDDFLFQIIGHMPGETIDVEVTFPENYGKEDLNGKDAVFVTTINYIAGYDYPELTDDFVNEKLSAEHGWKTVGELTEGTRSALQKNAVSQYIKNYIGSQANVKSVPPELLEYQNNAMMDYYQGYAEYYGMELEEFITSVMGISGVDELVSVNHEGNLAEATHGLVLQAIAEDYGFEVGEEDLKNYFLTYAGSEDYSDYEAEYGLPYLKQLALYQKILDFIAENAVLN